MEAAEGIFGGEFDHIPEEQDVHMAGPSRSAEVKERAKVTVQD
jgi:hypothetical protein